MTAHNANAYFIISDEVVITGMNHEFHSNDGFLALPTSSLGLQYYAVAYSPPTIGTQLSIAALYNNTKITVMMANNPTVSVEFPLGRLRRGGESLTITLNSLEALQVRRLAETLLSVVSP